jgi:hypothetical protein
MKELELDIIDASVEVFELLERKKIVRRFLSNIPTSVDVPEGEYFSRTVYKTPEIFGTHKLNMIAKNMSSVQIAYHRFSEDIILIKNDSTSFQKPLLFVVSLLKVDELLKRIETKRITNEDFLCLRLKYNDPELSFFTILEYTAHAELTIPGNGGNEIFFVTEPSEEDYITIDSLNGADYRININWGTQSN